MLFDAFPVYWNLECCNMQSWRRVTCRQGSTKRVASIASICEAREHGNARAVPSHSIIFPSTLALYATLLSCITFWMIVHYVKSVTSRIFAMNETTDPRPDNESKPLLFGQVKFHIFTTDDLVEDTANNVWHFTFHHGISAEDMKLSRVLTEQGAEEVSRCSTDQKARTLDGVTHIISTTSDFPDYEKAKNAMIPVAKPEWVTACVTKGRLANPRQYSPDPRLFFSGVVVCCADLPDGDKDAIIGGVLAMGGLFTSSVSRLVTHIVALTLEADKCQIAASRRLTCKIVLPHW